MPVYFGIPGEPGSEPRSRNEPDRPPVPLDLISGRERPAAPVVEQERPAFWSETLPAAFRQGNLISSTYDRVANYPGGFQDDPNFDPAEHIAGHEADWRHFVRANSVEEVQFIKDKLAAERADREVLQQAGGVGLATTLAAGVVDPWTLASMALPAALPVSIGSKAAIAAGTAVKLSRAERVWAAVAANAALDTAGEIGMHRSQELRTLSDSLLTIGVGTFLTGAVGTIATRVPKSEFDAVVRALENEAPVVDAAVRTAGSDSAGAARLGADLSLEDEGIATPVGRAIAQTLGQVSPQTRVLLSPVKTARRLIQELAHLPYLLEKNLKGIAGPEAIEDLVNHQVRRRQVEMRNLMDSAFASHKAAGGTLTHREFSAAIARELDGIPQPNAPQASTVVQWARKLLNEDRARIRELPGYEKFADEMDAGSYFPHVFDKEKLIKDEVGFKQMLHQDFKENPLIPKGGEVEREKLIAARRQGVSDAAINLEIAEREASDAVQAYEAAKGQLNLARQQAVGRGGAKDLAHRAKRTAQAKRREAAKLKRQLDKLNTRLENMLDETPPRLEAEIDAEAAVKRARRDEVRKSLGAIKEVGRKTSQTARRLAAKVRSTTSRAARLEARVTELLDSGDPKAMKQAERLDNAAYNMRQQADAATRDLASARSQVDELRGQLDAAKKELDDLSDELFDLRAEKAIGRSQTTAVETLDNLRGQKLNRAADAADELRDAEAVAKQLKQRAVTARKLARALKRPTKEARKAKIKAERIARAAQIPQRTDAEIAMAVDDVWDNIMGQNLMLTPDNVRAGANALKSRKLTTASSKLDPWLVRDAETVLNRYSRRTIPEIELRTRFGTSTMTDQIKAVQEEFTALRAAAAGKPNSEKVIEALNKQQENVINDLLTVVNRIAGRSAQHEKGTFARNWVRAQRVIRTYNYVRLLGSQTVSSMSDTGRLVARYGLPKTVHGMAKLLLDSNFRNLTKANMRRMGSAFETMFDFRMQQMADLVDEAGAVSRTDKAMEAIGGAFSRLTLMSQWNEMLKVGVGALEQDALIRKVASDTLSAFDKAHLVRAGVDDADLSRLADMVRRHADTTEGLGRLRTEMWEDKHMAALMERHIMSLGDEVVLTRGAGDLPAMMDKELVKTWLQFRTFAIASVNRTMIPVAQGLSMGDAKMAQGVASMLTLGAMTYYAKERLAGREPDLNNPGRLAAEAFNWSGLIAFFPDLWDVPAKTLHLPTFSRFMSRSPMETLGGPTFGSGVNFQLGVISNLADGTLKQSDIHGIRRMLPFQNLFYFSRLLNAIEGEIGETLGAEGSNRKDFTTRLAEEVPSKEAK